MTSTPGTRRAAVRAARAAAATVLAVALHGAALAGTTGKLSGRAVDGAHKPLAGVNVAIPAARTGAITDEQGRYTILNLPSGTYEVRANLLGYRAVLTQDVRISADQTTTLDLTLEEAPVSVKEVVVSAKRPVVDLKLTSNLATVHREDIRTLPVQELQDVVNLQAGVVDGHFRGGRLGEVQYQVNGVTVNNPYDNTVSIKLDRSLLEEVQIISGTFDAEYGQAMSGVVNAVLRRGGQTLAWDGEAMAGGWVYDAGSRGVIDELRPGAIQNFTATLSGPLPALAKTTFIVNAKRAVHDDYILASRQFTPWRDDTSALHKIEHPDGDGEREPLGQQREWSGMVRFTNTSIPNVTLDYQALLGSLRGRRSDWNFRFDPDGMTRQRTETVVHGLDVTRTFGTRRFVTTSIRQNIFDYRDMAYDDGRDLRYLVAGQLTGDPSFAYGAWVEGVDFTRFRQTTHAIVWKNTFVDQFRPDQQFKAGAEFEWPNLSFGTPGVLSFVSLGGDQTLVSYGDRLARWRPYIASGYAQEELEWNDLRVRAGARLEYFNARAGVPSDLANPANTIAGVPESHIVPTTRKFSIAPRIGVSYPVTQKVALFFAYGHFYQMPALGTVFANADYSVLGELQAGGISYGVLGNPDIRPERTVQYQFGYKQAITDDFGVDATVFYKDIRDLLGVEFVSTYNGAEYARLTNVDFGDVLGGTLAVHRRSGLLSTTLDYTWQMAEGDASDARETATRAAAGEDPRPRSVPFDWDQRNTLNLTVAVDRRDRYDAAFVLRAASGQPYTPAITTGFGNGLEHNSGRKPPAVVMDVRGERIVRVAGQPMSLFGRVFNLLDTRYDNGFVFDTSGSPFWSRATARDAATLGDPTRFYPARRIELGVTVHHGD